MAAAILRRLGCHIVAANYHSPWGEVDLIARQGEYILFVEVKTRRSGGMVSGAAAVGRQKQRKIIATALHYLQQHPEEELQPRFDVLSIVTDREGQVLSHDYLMGAFDGGAFDQ